MVEKITDEQLYKTLCDMIAERDRNALDAFKLFISLYSAIVGGAIWISTQATKLPVSYGRLSGGIVALVTVVAVILVIEANEAGGVTGRRNPNLLAKKEMGSTAFLPPKWFPTVLTEGAMVVCMVLAAIGFIWFNPLSNSN